VADTSGVGVPLNLTVGSPGNVSWTSGGLTLTGDVLISSVGAASKVIDAVKSTGEVTVEAWVDPANLTQNGPARIVTISSSPLLRNVTLGQGVFNSSGDRVEARVRTTGYQHERDSGHLVCGGEFGCGVATCGVHP